jgi:hypothetical protein
MVTYELNSKGLKIRNRLYPYENMKAFWIQRYESEDGEIACVLFIKSSRAFLPIITIPLENTIAERVHAIISEQNISEEEIKEHPTEKIMEYFGF